MACTRLVHGLRMSCARGVPKRPTQNGTQIRRKSLRDRYLHRRLDLRSLGAFPSPGASAPVWNQSRPFRPADAQLPVPTAFPHPPHTLSSPYPPRILTVEPLQTLQRFYGEDTGRIRCGNGGEREPLEWARQPKSLPVGGNRANQALIGWRNGRIQTPASGCRGLIPDRGLSQEPGFVEPYLSAILF